jgi:L,D-peptidoglycan transpeptidase YkuD (ErfK/YbiS/YcfS/YnhG family)
MRTVMTMKRVLGRLAVVATLMVAMAVSPLTSARAAEVDPSMISSLGDAQQVVIVTAKDSRTTYGTLTAWEREGNGSWRRVIATTTARLGFSGTIPARDRRQGTGKTPTGTFGFVSGFGRRPDPGTKLPYRHIDRDDAWTYNPRVPRTYNMMQTAPRSWNSYGGYVERLWSYGIQYDYVAVMDYNLPKGPVRTGADGIRRTKEPADTSRGGGIFLHASNGKVTAGCIAIDRDRMRAVMRWLDPAKSPVIVVGLESTLLKN